jgi:hypothetical protein
MADSTDILWNFYQEHCAWERHHEEQRASVTNILLVVAAGVLSVITFGGISRSDLPLTIFLIMQGLFGALFVAKQYERFTRHQRLANVYREVLNVRFPENRIILLRDLADKEQKEKYPILSDEVRLYQLWVGLHLLIALFGVVLTGFVLAAPINAV